MPIVAETLGLPQPSMNVLAMTLRKNGLISSGGRGRGGAEMRPPDVTNLLLAAMAGGHAKDAHEIVARLREASVTPGANQYDDPPRPIENLPLFMQPHSLGAALDAILVSYAADGGLIDDEYQLPITNISLTVTFPHLVCYRAELWLDNGSENWTLRYHRNHPAFDGVPKDKMNDVARSLLAGRGDLEFTARVTSTTFYDLAQALEESAADNTAQQLRETLARKTGRQSL